MRLQICCPPITPPPVTYTIGPGSASYLSGNTVEVLAQHPSHVLPSMGRHLMLQQEGELAAFTDAVEMAVNLVVLATCKGRMQSGLPPSEAVRVAWNK